MPGETVYISGAKFLIGAPTKTQRFTKHRNNTASIAARSFVCELQV
jgi:hypothetical protein